MNGKIKAEEYIHPIVTDEKSMEITCEKKYRREFLKIILYV